MKNIFKSFFLYAYFLTLFVALIGVLNYIEKLILFNFRPHILCADTLNFLDVPLMITLFFCAHLVIKKLYKRLVEKMKIQLNKTQFAVLLACLIFSIGLAGYSFVASKTEIYSDGYIKVYDCFGKVSETRTVDEVEKVELKVERTDYVKRNGIRSDICTMEVLLSFPDGKDIKLYHDYFRDTEAMKTLKTLAGDKFVMIQDREKVWELIGIADYDLYKIYCELLPEPEDRPLTYYEESWDQFTRYEFGN